MRLVIGSDHGGVALKSRIMHFLEQTRPDITLINIGTDTDASVDYPDFARKGVSVILEGKADAGILICGTGLGISMMANRFKGIRAAVVHDVFTAEMSKAHNNANILCLGGRTTDPELASTLVRTWLETKFEGGRHQSRIDKLDQD